MARPPDAETSTVLSHFAFEPADNPQLTAAAEGQIAGREVHVELPFGSTLSALVPRIEHGGASVTPQSGVAQDFSQPVAYTVTAADGSAATYTVTVDVLSELSQPSAPDAEAPLDATKRITSFSIAGVAATISDEKIELTVPHDTHLLNITPELAFEGAAILPSPLAPQDFTAPVVYTVMAEDGSTLDYTVYVSVAANRSKAITHFKVFGIESTITGTDITLVLPAGTDLSMLQPAITLSGGTVSPPSGAQQDFSQPVAYTVTGEDGSTVTYTVTAALAAGSANDIASFEVPSVFTSFRGDEITLFAPFGARDCLWAPAIVHAGARIEPASGEPQDFARGVRYTVIAADGSSRSYTATCRIAQTSARGIASFEVLGLPATIIGDDITLTVPSSVSLGALTPTIVHHGVRLSPASGVAQSFYGPVTYTLLEANGEKRSYTVRIVNADRSDNELVDLVYDGRHARIAGQKVELTLPAGSDVTALTPTLMHRGLRVSPTATTRDFSTPQIYSVIARDGSPRDYEVSIRVAADAEKALTDFTLGSAVGELSSSEVALRLPADTDLRALVPSRLQHTGVRIEPAVDEPQDFTRPVSYVVSAADGSTQTYVVRAALEERSANHVSGFRVLGVDALITSEQIRLALPAGTQLSALVPTIATAGTSIQPLSSLPQDFSEPVSYIVTAADGSTRTFVVSLGLAE